MLKEPIMYSSQIRDPTFNEFSSVFDFTDLFMFTDRATDSFDFDVFYAFWTFFKSTTR